MWEKTASFWATRDEWAASRIEAQAKGKRIRANMDLARKLANWKVKAPQYMRAAKPGNPRALVQPPSDLNPDIADLLEKIATTHAASMDDEFSAVMGAAFENWPVYSGLSKSLLNLQYEADADGLIAVLSSNAPYTSYIAGKPAKRWIRDPGIEAGKRVGIRALEGLSNG